MKRILIQHLICPACLPKERPLELSVSKEQHGDIISGQLNCRKCRKSFPIKDGIALLVPVPDAVTNRGNWKYEAAGTVDRYLWSHYADLLKVECAGDAYTVWASLLAERSQASFDSGCAVGRLTFEMAERCELAVGCDLSPAFIRTARQLARDGMIRFSMQLEGNLREEFHFTLPERWKSDKVEFIIADAQAIPFACGTFQQVASLNLIDRVNYPLAHLFDISRIAAPKHASFLFSDPFSWSAENTPEELWLGGKTDGPYPGHGIDNVKSILKGNRNIITPPWEIAREGSVDWRLRTHRNHFEMIRSEFLALNR